jgi:S1-C subfamily serine protease
MLYVKANLGINTKLSKKPPRAKDKVFASGYPALYPHIVSEGRVAGVKPVNIAIGSRACTILEKAMTPLPCLIEGMTETKSYKGLITTALVMPGSSGSGMFNAKGEIIGLVFATRGTLGYAIVVPHYYVKYFVENEMKMLDWQRPNPYKHSTQQEYKGLYDLDNWKEILKLLEEKNNEETNNNSPTE